MITLSLGICIHFDEGVNDVDYFSKRPRSFFSGCLQYVRTYRAEYHPKRLLEEKMWSVHELWKQLAAYQTNAIVKDIKDADIKNSVLEGYTRSLVEELDGLIVQKYNRRGLFSLKLLAETRLRSEFQYVYNLPCVLREMNKLTILQNIAQLCEEFVTTVIVGNFFFFIY